MSDYVFTSESVTEGHPDKVADQISDSILDAILTEDPHSRVACETLVTTGLALIAGEVTTKAQVNYQDIVRNTIKEIGYNDSSVGFDYKTCAVMVTLDSQSADIAMGVDSGSEKEQGAGDQGLMFGYACNHTEEFMPLPLVLSHKLMMRLSEARKDDTLGFLRPDGKGQVTIEYKDGKAVGVKAVVVSSQHSEEVSDKDIQEGIMEEVIKKVIPSNLLNSDTIYHINPTGRFVIGGPNGDCGLTGRKIIVDTYGGHGSHGGGAFSGKDPSKVDRSASYMARYIAKNIVAAGIADECEVQLAYAIGIAEPMSVMVDTFGTGKVSDDKIVKLVWDNFGLKPAEIIRDLDLLRPIYSKTAAYGHFGRNLPEFTWEKIDKVDALKSGAGI